MSKLEQKLTSSAFLMLLTRLSVKGLGIISSLILVRLLDPADFGTVAIVMSIYAFIELFGLFGFNTAIIQKTAPSKDDYDTVFTINLTFGLVATLALYVSSPYLAQVLGNEQLTNALKAVALMFLINAVVNVKVVDFQRSMDFKKELVLQLVPKVLSFFITLYLAWQIRNYWALVYGMLALSTFNVLQSYIMCPYRPRMTFKQGKELFSFSKWLMLNNFLFYLNTKSIDLIVGKFISTKAAGLYSISQEMASLPVSEIAAPINKASYPAYSIAKDNKTQLAALFVKTTAMITLLSLPLSSGLYAVAHNFVPVVLGQKWLTAIPLIQLLALTSLIATLSANTGYIFMALGRPRTTFFVSLFRCILFIFFLYLLISPDQLSSPAIASLLATSIATLVSLVLALRIIGLSLIDYTKAVLNPIIAAAFMSLAIQQFECIVANTNLTSFTLLLTEVSLGGIVYISVIVLLWIIQGRQDTIEKSILNKLGLFNNNNYEGVSNDT